MKKCTKCKISKRLSEFPVNKINKDGRGSHCLKCRRSERKQWGADKKDALSKKRREWYVGNKKHAIDYSKRYNLTRYGISTEQYAEMLVRQDGLCKICGQPRTEKFALSVDHDHASGKIRGLLCGNCNFILGHAKDNPSLLRKAAEYLENS